jgi:hypothetical protein
MNNEIPKVSGYYWATSDKAGREIVFLRWGPSKGICRDVPAVFSTHSWTVKYAEEYTDWSERLLDPKGGD